MNDNTKAIAEQKAIEEIARKVLTERTDIRYIPELSEPIATALTAAGYRKQGDTVKEFAEKATARIFEGITQRFCDCYNDGLHGEYLDRELSRNFLMAFDECKNIAKREINELAAEYGKEDSK